MARDQLGELEIIHPEVLTDLTDECVPNFSLQIVHIVSVCQHRLSVEHNVVGQGSGSELATLRKRHTAVHRKHLQAAISRTILHRHADVVQLTTEAIRQRVHLISDERFKLGFRYILHVCKHPTGPEINA